MRDKLARLAALGAIGICFSYSPAAAQSFGEWSVAFAQGYEEHIVRNGPGNSFNISCDVGASGKGEQKRTNVFVEIIGKDPPPKSLVDIFIEDQVFRFPTDERGTITTDCHVCSDNFSALWSKLRRSKVMVVQLSDGRSSRFKTIGAAKALPAKHCVTGFEN